MPAGKRNAFAKRVVRSRTPLFLVAVALTVYVRRLAFLASPASGAFRPRVAAERLPRGTCSLRSRIAAPARGGAEELDEDDDDDDDFDMGMVIGPLKVGQQLEGVVVRILDRVVMVDVGADREGMVPISKLREGKTPESTKGLVKLGQAVKVWVSESTATTLVLSMAKGKILPFQPREAEADLSEFEGISSSEWLSGNVVNVMDFGAFVSVKAASGKSAQGLVYRTERVGEPLIGDSVKVRLLKVDTGARKMSLSMKEEVTQESRWKDVSAFEGVPSADWLEGTVVSKVEFGAFVEVQPPGGEPSQAVQGLVHVSQMKDAVDVSEGDTVQVRVLKVDVPNGKVSLSMKPEGSQSESGQDISVFEWIPPDEWLTGTVKGVADFGAFVEIQFPGGDPSQVVQGLVHTSQMKNKVVEVSEGDSVQVRVHSVDAQAGKISLSMIEGGTPGGGVSAFEAVPDTTWLEGTVVSKADFGAFVKVQPPGGEPSQTVEGLVHVSQMKDGVDVSKGDTVQVRVLRVDVQGGKMSLSMKPDQRAAKDVSAFEQVPDTEWLEGRVVSTVDFGAFVEIQPPGGEPSEAVQGLVHVSEMTGGADVSAGDTVKVRVLTVDVQGGKISLSMVPEGSKSGGGGPQRAAKDVSAFEGVPDTEWLEGRVVNLVDFGAFVEVQPPGGEPSQAVQGLVHVSEMKGKADVSEGDTVQVRVLSVDVPGEKISLSMVPEGSKSGAAKDVSAFEEVPDTEWLEGRVVSKVNFGAFVEIQLPGGEPSQAAQGLLHSSQMKDGVDLSEGDTVQVRVLSVDVPGEKISLSTKGDLSAFDGVPDTQWLQGTVKSFVNDGAIIEVQPPSGGSSVEGLVHISRITEGFIEDPGEELEIDQEVNVRILKVDKAQGRMALSMV